MAGAKSTAGRLSSCWSSALRHNPLLCSRFQRDAEPHTNCICRCYCQSMLVLSMLESRMKLTVHPHRSLLWSNRVAYSWHGMVVVKLLAHSMVLPHGPAPSPSRPPFPLCHGLGGSPGTVPLSLSWVVRWGDGKGCGKRIRKHVRTGHW